MNERYFEVENDGVDCLQPADQNRHFELMEAKQGSVRIGQLDGSVHVVEGSRYVTKGIGFHVNKQGHLEVRLNENTAALRTYGAWAWVEGDSWHAAYFPPQVF
ncbi:hypothetical protein [Cellulomonas sp. RIT-PI-Y]|uniref:hypothetical protein n=1 Tax=Cellulomonas sp. RIT-PI-Y TaxID=3035297 RepID=UPI0021D989A9|nr:hypothetical protein [Cellulomonas sp. RIT-PI-Y]